MEMYIATARTIQLSAKMNTAIPPKWRRISAKSSVMIRPCAFSIQPRSRMSCASSRYAAPPPSITFPVSAFAAFMTGPSYAMQRHRRGVILGEKHLIERGVRCFRGGHAGAQVELPHLLKGGVVALDVQPRAVRAEVLQPALRCVMVVTDHVLDVENGQAFLFEAVRDLGELRLVGVGKDVLGAERIVLVLRRVRADGVHESHSIRRQHLGDFSEVAVVFAPRHVLHHADADHAVELRLDLVEVGVFDFHAIVQTFALRAGLSELELTPAQGHAGPCHAVMLRGVDEQAAEAAADVEQAVAFAQPQLLADALELVLLQRVEILARIERVAARIRELLIEKSLEQIVAEIVVALDVHRLAFDGVDDAHPADAQRDAGPRHHFLVEAIAQHDLEQQRELVVLDDEVAGHERLGHTETAGGEGAGEDPRVGDAHGDVGLVPVSVRPAPHVVVAATHREADLCVCDSAVKDIQEKTLAHVFSDPDWIESEGYHYCQKPWSAAARRRFESPAQPAGDYRAAAGPRLEAHAAAVGFDDLVREREP